MIKKIGLPLALLISLNCYSQVIFEKGYFTNNNGEKTECFIKNSDWMNNPTEFKYKLTESSNIETNNIDSVKEFGALNSFKYGRFIVKIDQSSELMNELSENRDPEFLQDTVFLKILVEGKVNLYYYEGNNLRRYFFSTDNSDIEQLVYKTYLVTKDRAGENNTFRQQLQSNLKCEGITPNHIKNVRYRKNDLVSFFITYNKCMDSDFVNYQKKQERGSALNFNIRPGINISSASYNDMTSNYDMEFDSKITFRFGIEAEYILPFNKNKWAIIVEPTYQYYKSGRDLSTTNYASIDYKSIEFPLGLRYYIFLNKNSKIFLNAAYIIDWDLNSKINFSRFRNDIEIKSWHNLAFGLGYNYNDKYSTEIRYGLDRELLSDYAFLFAKYRSLSLIFGYNLK